MKHRKRNIRLILQILVILTALLACDISSCTKSPPLTGDFTGRISDWPTAGCNADISIRATSDQYNNQDLAALFTDGSKTCQPTVYAHVSGSVGDIPTKFSFAQGYLSVDSLKKEAVTGTISYQNTSNIEYIAQSVSDPPLRAGLYIGEAEIKGIHYEAGWVVLPTGEQREAVKNRLTGALMMAPLLTAADVASGQVLVPGLGVFGLTIVPVSIQSALTTSGRLNFQAKLAPQSADCSQTPGASTLTLDNTDSTVNVDWKISFKPVTWGTASLASDASASSTVEGTILAGQSTALRITPNNDLCLTGPKTYVLAITYTANGRSESKNIQYQVGSPGWG